MFSLLELISLCHLDLFFDVLVYHRLSRAYSAPRRVKKNQDIPPLFPSIPLVTRLYFFLHIKPRLPKLRK